MSEVHREPVEIDPHDQALLEQIGRLRVRAWATFNPRGVAGIDCWLDRFELSARHWVIFDNGEPIAAARMSVHSAIGDLPDASILDGVFTEPPAGPIASFNRLVVHPAYRGAALPREFDRVRLAAALQSGCRSAIAETNSGPKRIAQLEAFGFGIVGRCRPYPAGHFYFEQDGVALLNDLASRPGAIRATVNRMGWSSDTLSEIGAAFVDAAARCSERVLDIGAAYGVATIPALEAGATVVANDLARCDPLLAGVAFPHTRRGRRWKARGDRWPGMIVPLRSYNHHWSAALNPSWLHVFDDEILSSEVRHAGFHVETARMFSRAGLPEFIRLDGRENLGLIASKPCLASAAA